MHQAAERMLQAAAPYQGLRSNALRPNARIRGKDLHIDWLACDYKAMRILMKDPTSFHCTDGISKNAKTGVFVLFPCRTRSLDMFERRFYLIALIAAILTSTVVARNHATASADLVIQGRSVARSSTSTTTTEQGFTVSMF